MYVVDTVPMNNLFLKTAFVDCGMRTLKQILDPYSLTNRRLIHISLLVCAQRSCLISFFRACSIFISLCVSAGVLFFSLLGIAFPFSVLYPRAPHFSQWLVRRSSCWLFTSLVLGLRFLIVPVLHNFLRSLLAFLYRPPLLV